MDHPSNSISNRLSFRKRFSNKKNYHNKKNVLDENHSDANNNTKITSNYEPSTSTSDQVIKVVVIGESGSGKSNLIQRLVNDRFDDRSPSTIGIDFSLFEFSSQNRSYHAQIWDTAGMERYRSSMTKIFYRDVLGALLVFDLCRRDHFDALPRWLNEIRSNVVHNGDEENDCEPFLNDKIPIILVGNKLDLVNNHHSSRQINKTEGNLFAHNNNLTDYIETSAKTNENVQRAFQILFANILEQRFEKENLLRLKQQQQNRLAANQSKKTRRSFRLTKDNANHHQHHNRRSPKDSKSSCSC